MHSPLNRFYLSPFAVALSFLCVAPLGAQEAGLKEAATEEAATEEAEVTAATVLDADGHLIRFERDIAPILRSQCLECHGPDDAKNDFRVDDVDLMMDYVEPEDLESSSLYVDYLVTDDDEMLMPPASHDGPLSAAELALIRVWIEEGANWPDGYELVADSQDDVAPQAVKKSNAPRTLGGRVWAFQGYLHPATVHFPIAFFMLGAMFVVLGWKWPSVGTQIPLACLLLGSLSAIVVTLMGWSFGHVQGYAMNWNIFDWSKEVNAHRWSGVIVAILSGVFAVIALVSLWKDNASMTKYWKIGLLVLAGAVGAVGHQGGEMSYGKDFYPKAFRILFGTDDVPKADASERESADDPVPDESAKSDGESAKSDDEETSSSTQ